MPKRQIFTRLAYTQPWTPKSFFERGVSLSPLGERAGVRGLVVERDGRCFGSAAIDYAATAQQVVSSKESAFCFRACLRRHCCFSHRSEERRVGKECRARWARDIYRK